MTFTYLRKDVLHQIFQFAVTVDDEFEQGLALRLRARAEVQRRRVLKEHEQRDLAFLDEFFPVGLAEPRGDVPVDVAHIVAKRVFHDLVELHAAAAEGGTVLAAEHVLDGVAHTPLEAAQP